MPIAAVPDYLGQDFSQASPGMRFGMYLKLWENPQTWSKSTNRPLDSVKLFNDNDEKHMAALYSRQKTAFEVLADGSSKLQIFAVATSPFTTGLGNEHPLENGFAFLNPYGLPYLPGSGVKGVVRQAARELACGDWGDTHGWDEAFIIALFGSEDANAPQRGALSFWDVIPQIKGNSLAVEIMTPHQGHYYQQSPAAGSISPHDSGQPNPISFLTVPPGSDFTFHVICDRLHLQRIVPQLCENDQWKSLLTQAVEHAFSWCGFGAKTAVGYGAMKRDHDAEQNAAQARAEVEVKARQAALPVNLKTIDEFEQAMKGRFEQLNGQKDRQNTEFHQKAQNLAKLAREGEDWTTEEKDKAAKAIEEWLPKVVERIDKDAFKKLKLSALRSQSSGA